VALEQRQIVVIGGGGHARVVIEVLLAAGWQVAGYTDAGGQPGESFAGTPWLGTDAILPAVRASGVVHAIVALGDNALRGRLGDHVDALGFERANALHPSACISPSVTLGRGIAVMAQAAVNAATSVGDNTIINTGATVDHDNRIGRDVHIAPGAHLAGYVTLEDRVLIGVGSVVGRGRPLRIGEGAVTGSGSVVFTDIAPRVTVVGNPARPLRRGNKGEG
jgi:UDP-perosamine 4-acetyltransferase